MNLVRPIPVLRIMRLPEWIAHTRMASSKHTPSPPSLRRRVQLELHQLIHVSQHEHIAIQLYDAVVLGERKGREFAPAVVEARVVAVVLAGGGEEVVDALFGDAAGVECGVAGGREGVCVQGDEGVGGFGGVEGVGEGEEAGEVGGVCDEGCPDWGFRLLAGSRGRGC
jgi:hypothetical protein